MFNQWLFLFYYHCPTWGRWCYLLFTDEETNSQVQLTGLRSHSDKCQMEPKNEASSLYSLTHSFNNHSSAILSGRTLCMKHPRSMEQTDSLPHGVRSLGGGGNSKQTHGQTLADKNRRSAESKTD